jgi:hypothetical protein
MKSILCLNLDSSAEITKTKGKAINANLAYMSDVLEVKRGLHGIRHKPRFDTIDMKIIHSYQ